VEAAVMHHKGEGSANAPRVAHESQRRFAAMVLKTQDHLSRLTADHRVGRFASCTERKELKCAPYGARRSRSASPRWS